MKIDDAFLKIFWGFLLVWIDIRIMIDILADPIGFYLIYSGIRSIVSKIPIGKKAEVIAILLVIFSIPTVLTSEPTAPVSGVTFSEWNWYFTILNIAVLILIFYMFQIINEITKQSGNQAFHKRAFRIGVIYFIVMFITQISSTFAINLLLESLMPIALILLIAGIIMHIVFLVLLDEVRKLKIELD
ncbi:MAG TPA: hypothetical protein VNR38_10255 [Ureibacillus sp.]|nr:hypothetical protein [Ureibacillus sp.]